MRYILASQSPRRKELLEKLKIPFEVIPSGADEDISGRSPEDTVKKLAQIKAEDVCGRIDSAEDITVIGADTVVVSGDRILGKPRGKEEAETMLRLLSGKTHQVFTGVCIITRRNGDTVREIFAEKTDVGVYELSDEEIASYIATDEPYDKAGGYAIQGDFCKYVKSICGDYNNVVGLPVAALYHRLG